MRRVSAAGLTVSAVGLGTWQFGAREWGYGTPYAREAAPAIVRRSCDLGVTLFDTAEIYSFGQSERILGRALGGRRAEAVLATKLFPVLPIGPIVGWRARASVARLGSGDIDLYQVHWPNPVIPDSATAAALASLLDDGVTRHVGVSNYPLARWRALEEALGRPVVSNQVRYSLVDRRPESELLPYAVAHDRLLIAYSPLGQGLLSGRYGPDHRPGAMRSRSKAFSPENLLHAAPLLDTLRQVAAAHGASPAQVALAWLLRRPNVVVIPGASSVEQAEANAEAADITLSDEEDAALRDASDAYRPPGRPTGAELARRAAGTAARRVRRVAQGLSG